MSDQQAALSELPFESLENLNRTVQTIREHAPTLADWLSKTVTDEIVRRSAGTPVKDADDDRVPLQAVAWGAADLADGLIAARAMYVVHEQLPERDFFGALLMEFVSASSLWLRGKLYVRNHTIKGR